MMEEIMNMGVLDILLFLAGIHVACYVVIDLLAWVAGQPKREAAQPNLTYFWRVTVACLLAAIYLKL